MINVQYQPKYAFDNFESEKDSIPWGANEEERPAEKL
jgi:hypothetical protein